MADLSYDELSMLEKPERSPVNVIKATSLDDIEKYLNNLPRKNITNIFEVEVVTGHKLEFSEHQLNDLIKSNRHYKKIIEAFGPVQAPVPKIEKKIENSEIKYNSKILTAKTVEEATGKSDISTSDNSGTVFWLAVIILFGKN